MASNENLPAYSEVHRMGVTCEGRCDDIRNALAAVPPGARVVTLGKDKGLVSFTFDIGSTGETGADE